MRVPKKLSRKTNHAKPRCQLYQPGFNPGNGCWLEGGWVTVSAGGFAQAAKTHEALYKNVRSEMKAQHYRDKGVALKRMTPIQRQAYEYFSGEGRFDVQYPDGRVGIVSMELGAGKPTEKSLKWLRGSGAKVIPKTLQPNGDKPKRTVNQTKGIPKDLLSDDKEPVDTWACIVKQNRDQAERSAMALAELASKSEGGEEKTSFMQVVAANSLIELEKSIVRSGGDGIETKEAIVARYVKLRTFLERSFGDRFDEVYGTAKSNYNECSRTNLDRSSGHLYCWVLPKFNADGTHEPLGPRDFPWAHENG